MLQGLKLGMDVAEKYMKQNKGQALVEFILVLPLIMMIIFVVIDFSNVFYQKNKLENTINEIVDLKENKISNEKIKNKYQGNFISYKINGKTLIITVSKNIKLVTPLSSYFFDNPYKIKTERTIIYE